VFCIGGGVEFENGLLFGVLSLCGSGEGGVLRNLVKGFGIRNGFGPGREIGCEVGNANGFVGWIAEAIA